MKIELNLSEVNRARLAKLAASRGETIEACASFLISKGIYTHNFAKRVYIPNAKGGDHARA